MRLNRFIASSTGISRRAADTVIKQGRVIINGQTAQLTTAIAEGDRISLDGQHLHLLKDTTTILLNKPKGYVVSRKGQGNKTIYELLPPTLDKLKPIGRLDKDSTGLLLLTSDGDLAQRLTHPSYQKNKVYQVELDKPLSPRHQAMITTNGVKLEDGLSKLDLSKRGTDKDWQITMTEGRNRQIRRTFNTLGYSAINLHRTVFGNYALPPSLKPGKYTHTE